MFQERLLKPNLVFVTESQKNQRGTQSLLLQYPY